MFLTGLWNEIFQAAFAQSWLEWLALVANLVYISLAARGNRWCWLFGGIGAVAFVAVVLQAKLYSDALLNAYYVAMAIYGWFTWKANHENDRIVPIRMNRINHVRIFLAGSILTGLLGLLFSSLGAAFPYLDGATTAFSFLATLLVAQRYLENWLYWIVIDLLSIGIYYVKELYLFAFLFIIYTVVAIIGWFAWKKMIKNPGHD